MIKIVYLDEEKSAHLNMRRSLAKEQLESDVELETWYPVSDLDCQVELLIESKADAFIFDYALYDRVEQDQDRPCFNGAQVIHSIKERCPRFPAFLITALDDDATNAVLNVSDVFSKEDLALEFTGTRKQSVPILKKIAKQATKYQVELEGKKSEFNTLIDKSKGARLSAVEISRLNELDNELEYLCCGEYMIPEALKIEQSSEALVNLLKQGKDLLEVLKR